MVVPGDESNAMAPYAIARRIALPPGRLWPPGGDSRDRTEVAE